MREEELKQSIAIYGQGSDQALGAEAKAARAKEAAAKQGATEAKQGAKDELGATIERANSKSRSSKRRQLDKIGLRQRGAGQANHRSAKGSADARGPGAGHAERKASARPRSWRSTACRSNRNSRCSTAKRKFEQQYADNVQKIQEDAAMHVAEQWNSAMSSINVAFTSQVDGLLTGTENFGTAFKKVLTSLTEDVIKFCVNWALQQAEAVARNLISQNSWVAANVTGNALITASQTAAAAAGTGAVVAQKGVVIASDRARRAPVLRRGSLHLSVLRRFPPERPPPPRSWRSVRPISACGTSRGMS